MKHLTALLLVLAMLLTLAPASAITPTVEDFLGYWQPIHSEPLSDSATPSSGDVSHGSAQGIAFNHDGALLYSCCIVSIDEDCTCDAPTPSPAAWVFQPDGSMDVLHGPYVYTFRYDGEHLIRKAPEAVITYARATAPAAPEPDASTAAAPGQAIGTAAAGNEAAFLPIFTHPATESDRELILISANAAHKVYNEADIADYLVSLGFPEDRIRQYDYDSPIAHSVGLTLACREVVNSNGATVTLYAVIARGTAGTAEWFSNFDMGDGDVAMGFDLAAHRVVDHFTNYITLYPPLDGASFKLWLTGHSRGAAVANLIAGQYVYLPQEQVYCVTFATPNVALQTSRATNILNFVIDGDVVTNVPFTSWGFDRHGLTVHYTDATLPDTELIPAEDMQLLLSFLGSVSQDTYYEMTQEVLHSDAATARNDMTLEDMLALNIAGIALSYLDHADRTILTLKSLGDQALMNTIFQQDMRILLGDAMPPGNRATFFSLASVVDNILKLAGPCHSMDAYMAWIECIHEDRPTTFLAPGGVGSR